MRQATTAPSWRVPATDVRVSDFEREAAVDELQSHTAAGRLAPDELEQRVEAALRARTRGDLARLVDDLPPVAPDDAGASQRRHGSLVAYASVMVLLVGIWLVTGGAHPWPLYPALGWGIPLLMARWSSGAPRPRQCSSATREAESRSVTSAA